MSHYKKFISVVQEESKKFEALTQEINSKVLIFSAPGWALYNQSQTSAGVLESITVFMSLEIASAD